MSAAHKRLASEDRRTSDQQVFVPGDFETGPDEQLVTVGRDDLLIGATELNAIQGVPSGLFGTDLRRLGERR